MRKPKKKPPVEFKYYSEKDFDYELKLSREFSDSDAIAKVLLYRINTITTKSHSLYGESKVKDKKWLPKVELNITLGIDDIKTDYISKGGIFNENVNIFNFGVYMQELEEKNINLNRGDFVNYYDGEKDRFYEITKVSNINSNNSTLGFKPFFVLVEATMVKENVIID